MGEAKTFWGNGNQIRDSQSVGKRKKNKVGRGGNGNTKKTPDGEKKKR